MEPSLLQAAISKHKRQASKQRQQPTAVATHQPNGTAVPTASVENNTDTPVIGDASTRVAEASGPASVPLFSDSPVFSSSLSSSFVDDDDIDHDHGDDLFAPAASTLISTDRTSMSGVEAASATSALDVSIFGHATPGRLTGINDLASSGTLSSGGRDRSEARRPRGRISFIARRGMSHPSLFDEVEDDDASSDPASSQPNHTETAQSSTSSASNSTTTAAASSSPIDPLPPPISEDEELASMLASFSPSLGFQLIDSSQAATFDDASSTHSSMLHPFTTIVSNDSNRTFDFDANAWGDEDFSSFANGTTMSASNSGSNHFNPFALIGADPSPSPPTVSTNNLDDSIYTVWAIEERDSEGDGGGNGCDQRRLKLTPSELQLLEDDGNVGKSFDYVDIFCVTCQDIAPTLRLNGVDHDDSSPQAASANTSMRTVSISFLSDADLSCRLSEQDAQSFAADLQQRMAHRRHIDDSSTTDKERRATPSSFLQSGSFDHALFSRPNSYTAASAAAVPTAATATATATATTPSTHSQPSDASADTSTMPPELSSNGGKTEPAADNKGDTQRSTGESENEKQSSSPTHSSPSSTSAPVSVGVIARSLQWQRKYALEQRIQASIDRLWLDPNNDECKARAKFLRGFSTMEKNADRDKAKNNNSSNTKENENGKNGKKKATAIDASDAVLTSTRRFVTSFRTYMEKKRTEMIMQSVAALLEQAIVEDTTNTNNSNGNVGDAASRSEAPLLTLSEFESSLNSRLERSAEIAIFHPLMPRLIHRLQGDTLIHEEEEQVAGKMKSMRGMTQQQMGVPGKHLSPSNWVVAQRELIQLDKYHLPCDKLEVLLGTAKAIYHLYNHEEKIRRMAMQTKEKEEAEAKGLPPPAPQPLPSTFSLPADDLFPIFVYIVSQTPLRQPVALKHLMWQLCDQAQLNGEGGYYLNSFSAALEYIRTVDLDKLLAESAHAAAGPDAAPSGCRLSAHTSTDNAQNDAETGPATKLNNTCPTDHDDHHASTSTQPNDQQPQQARS